MTESVKLAVWNKATVMSGNDPARWRQDGCRAWIGWAEYGNRDSQYGWEVDHIDPNGGDHIGNLRALQWENNVAKSDGRPVCAVTARGQNNVRLRTYAATR